MQSEWQFLEQIRRKIALPRQSSVVAGIGDDCAIYRPKGSPDDLLFTTDMLIEDVHFRRETHSAEDVGWKALARGLSDIAAMGGEPRFFLMSLALTPRTSEAWVAGFYRGMLRLAGRAGTILVGGDLGHGEKLFCDIVVCGSVPRGQALRRDGAKAGDAIYVSGRLGGSALGLAKGRGVARRKHLRPEPRLALGRFLRERLHATSAMDLSDGLSLDLWRLCRASKLAASVEAPPRFPGATLDQSLHGGEDYELLFTVAPQTRVPSAHDGVKLTRIGIICKGLPGAVLLNEKRLEPLGYDHFARNAKLR